MKSERKTKPVLWGGKRALGGNSWPARTALIKLKFTCFIFTSENYKHGKLILPVQVNCSKQLYE